jgi:hypothetical protein
VPTNAAITVVLDEPVNPVSVTSTSLRINDGATQDVAGTRSVSAGGRTISFVPAAPLAVGQPHTVLSNRTIRDLAGNVLFGPSFSFTTSFTADTTGPQVLVTSPGDGFTDVPTNVRIEIGFDEPLQTLSIDQVTLSSDGAPVDVKRTLAFGNQTLTLIPLVPLALGTVHTSTIDGVLDIGGNAIEAPVSSTFTTGAGIDLVRPRVVTTTPFANATDVPIDAVISVTLDEPINPLTVTASRFNLRDDTTFQNVAGTRSVSADRRTVIFTPDQPLEVGRTYTIVLGLDAQAFGIDDLAGNRTDRFTSPFTTAP